MKRMLIAALTLTVIAGCKKNDTGGKATIVAFPKHHSAPIKGATIYVKFDATELPSNPTSNYDLKITGEPTEEHVHIEGMRYGEYYLYAVGYDSTISEVVKGGVAVKLKWKERKDETDVNVPVVE